MPRDNRRSERVAERIREEAATFLTDGVKDPRVTAFVTVTGVDITPDMRHAKIFVSLLGDEQAKNESFEGLQSVTGHLRTRLAKSLRLRFAPEIEFRRDQSVERAGRIESLLAQIRDAQPPEPPSSPGDGAEPGAEGRAD
ncbi:MAG: 30S ribosome-binding factor RbfA [Gemmatimonadota bacterium]|nr:30S ribosome-binding factor RbfA [Gemmatimonadota bacterium]